MQNVEWMAVGAFLNSALYLTFCFVAGLVEHRHAAECLAIGTAGICFLAYFLQMGKVASWVVGGFVFLSIVTGAAAGIAIL